MSCDGQLIDTLLKKESMVLLRGPNGSGKTTLLYRFLEFKRASHSLDQVHYIAHKDGLKAYLTVYETLSFWCQLFGEKSSSLFEVASHCGLELLLQKRIAHLSFGQKRRVCLARLCLVSRPIWVLDEPDVGLDEASFLAFKALLNDHLTKKGGQILMASHKPALAGQPIMCYEPPFFILSL